MKHTPNVYLEPARKNSLSIRILFTFTFSALIIVSVYTGCSRSGGRHSRFEDARIVENIPKVMKIRQPEKITVRISRKTNEDIFRRLEGNGDIETHSVPSSSFANVMLKGDDGFFDISLKNGAEEKTLSSYDYTDWYFEVTPKQAGEANLYLNVDLISRNQTGKQGIRELPIIKKIRVEDDMMDNILIYLQNNFLAILAILVPSVVGLLAIAAFRDKLSPAFTLLSGKIKQILGRQKDNI
jgi:hypothetical protein